MMDAIQIIRKKRDGGELTKEEIRFFIDGYTKDSIPDYQMSSLLMAIFLNGLTAAETFAFTESMVHSGDVIDFDEIRTYKADKHSTGGVGDKISIILAPLVASCGLVVPMMSGRGLGHSGGTLDKLESIPGFNTQLSMEEFRDLLHRIGVAMIGQTKTLAPADKKIYALRDVTGTVESIPLITVSILSKKLAEGIDGLVMDIKVGSGAFMKTFKQAKALAYSIKNVVKRSKKDIVCLITNMDEPLGRSIGNSLEILECIDVLKGKGPKDIIDLTVELSAYMLKMGGIEKDLKKARELLVKKLKDGDALNKFRELVSLHGGDPGIIEDSSILGDSRFRHDIRSPKGGYLAKVESEDLGFALARLGAGRVKVTDKVDHTVGMVLNKKVGEKILKGETIATVHYNDEAKFSCESSKLASCFKIKAQKPKAKKLILGVIN